MAEGLEAFNAVVGTHAGRTDAAKGHVFLGDMEDHIVDADAAGGGAMQEGFLFALVDAEVIGRQRTRVSVDVIDGVIEILVGADRQQRPEDFFFHTERVILRRHDERRWNLAGTGAEILISGIQRNDAAAALFGIFKVAAQALVVALVNHRGVLVVVTQARVHFVDCLGGETDHFLQLFFGHQQVVGSETDLASVERLTQHDALHRLLQVRCAGDHDRRLAAEFQRYRHQIACRGGENVAGDIGRTGEDHVIKGQGRERLTDFGAAREGGDLGGIECLGDDLFNDL